ncbi:hypothetical protein CCACVL1_10489 [Corchorus capsularis]|uniref:Uncharacterized protein n=1 Tax=Corchorus capsularis TaxID=210143 RepID=A0A1R3IQY5_COCAP|nr:hypothetical protein CCACVL1_10489 [Corchorus capsularis]
MGYNKMIDWICYTEFQAPYG